MSLWYLRNLPPLRPVADRALMVDGKPLANWRWIGVYVKGWRIGKLLGGRLVIGRELAKFLVTFRIVLRLAKD